MMAGMPTMPAAPMGSMPGAAYGYMPAGQWHMASPMGGAVPGATYMPQQYGHVMAQPIAHGMMPHDGSGDAFPQVMTHGGLPQQHMQQQQHQQHQHQQQVPAQSGLPPLSGSSQGAHAGVKQDDVGDMLPLDSAGGFESASMGAAQEEMDDFLSSLSRDPPKDS